MLALTNGSQPITVRFADITSNTILVESKKLPDMMDILKVRTSYYLFYRRTDKSIWATPCDINGLIYGSPPVKFSRKDCPRKIISI